MCDHCVWSPSVGLLWNNDVLRRTGTGTNSTPKIIRSFVSFGLSFIVNFSWWPHGLYRCYLATSFLMVRFFAALVCSLFISINCHFPTYFSHAPMSFVFSYLTWVSNIRTHHLFVIHNWCSHQIRLLRFLRNNQIQLPSFVLDLMWYLRPGIPRHCGTWLPLPWPI